MIRFLIGNVVEVTNDMVELDVSGVGYGVFVPTSVVARLGRGDRNVLVYTSMSVGDGNMSLYGFMTAEERDIFELLLKVSGIGPRAAVKLLSLPKATLVESIAGGEVDMLTTIPGIGPKTAKRVVLELKDKVSAIYGVEEFRREYPPEAAGEVETAMQGLKALGYSPSEIRNMLKTMPAEALKGKPATEIIKACLRKPGRRGVEG
ncbi:MAG: Holliday junction branch migration protein RuvA [bacterium]